MKRSYQPKRPTKTTQWDGHTSPMKIHCTDYAFLKLLDENPGVEHKNYLQINWDTIGTQLGHLRKDYAVITTGYTAKVREFKANHINSIVKRCKELGLEVVFLGQKETKTGAAHVIQGNFDTSVDYAHGIDLRDKTNLLQAAEIMSGAKAVLGVDNGLLHLAGCTQVPIIGGFTTVAPELRMPVRNNVLGWNYYPVVPDTALPCTFCQSNTNFLYGHDYTKCIYKDYACLDHMTAAKFINILETL